MKSFHRIMIGVFAILTLQTGGHPASGYAAPVTKESTTPTNVESTTQPKANDFGVGAILGAPTGLSMKYWLTNRTALDTDLAWHLGDNTRFEFNVDHLWHFMVDGVRVPYGRMPFYVGVGLRVLAGHDPEAGVRIPVGAAYLLAKAPVEVFAELAPVARFAPSTGADLDGGIGARYYFK